MVKSPLTVSIVIPVYGVEKYIAEFADSAFTQTYPHIQYVFVNDGTKDRSIEVLEDIIDNKYPSVKDRVVIVNKQNGGLPSARKAGMEHVTGDYVWHVDPDDWIDKDAVECIVDKIEETGADVVYFNLVKEYSNRSKVKRDKPHGCHDQRQYVHDMFNHRSFGSVCNKCIKKSLYDNPMIIFAEYSYAEDTFLTSQLVGSSSCIAFLDKPLYHYRKTNPNSITRQNLTKRHREYALNFMRLYQHYQNVPVEQNPIASIKDDILMRLGWYSVFYRLDLYTLFPSLSALIRDVKMSFKMETNILIQAFVKIYSRFK